MEYSIFQDEAHVCQTNSSLFRIINISQDYSETFSVLFALIVALGSLNTSFLKYYMIVSSS